MRKQLASATKLYLRQRANDPVDWYPCGEEALEKARIEDRPIFLSIGYLDCRWCRIMARESFEDERMAAVLNRHFASIKVDRDERPDLERVYVAAVQATWPTAEAGPCQCSSHPRV